MKNSLAVAIEALSWMAYSGIGERAALLKASGQLNVKHADELRQGHRIIMETTRFQNRLDHILSQAIPAEETRKLPHGLRSLLRIVAYLKYVDHASPSELVRTVAIARQILGWHEIQPFEIPIAEIISGKLTLQVAGISEYERISLQTCHPAWFVQRLVQGFGRAFALRILQGDMQPVDTYVRINSLKVPSESKRAEIGKQLGGLKVERLVDTYVLSGKGRPFRLIESGEVIIQDFASTVAGQVASPRAGQVVLDVCAAPGNKTSHLAAQMHNEGAIYSLELSARRLSYWNQQMRVCGCEIATPIRTDARRIPIRGNADVVLVDPPCSNSGVFSRSPAGKWTLTPARLTELSLRQRAILEAASQHVKVDGTLVYCTCSVLPEEDEYVIEDFRSKNPEFRLVPQQPFLGLPGLRGLDRCQRFYPHIHRCNGYFIAKFKRTA